jgi:hypothetical protein
MRRGNHMSLLQKKTLKTVTQKGVRRNELTNYNTICPNKIRLSKYKYT